MFHVISDAGCDFTQAEAKKYGVDIVPFYILHENGIQKTSQPNPQDYIDVFIPHLKEGRDILVLTISSKLSGSYNSATLAADMLKDEYPKQMITVVDSLSASMGQGLLLREILHMREAGYCLQNTARLAREIVKTLRLYVTVENLDHLKRGGRISTTKAFVGGVLGLRPVLHIVDGAVVPLATVRGKKNIFKLIQTDAVRAIKNEAEDMQFAVGHVQSEADAQALNQCLETALAADFETPLVAVGVAISTHTGPGALAFAYCKKYAACERGMREKAA